ncbi:putative membrane protein [Paenibacillus shirakamiensis]|uniref:Membrane protein n=1 Tax=Paenibacillus shirakamiensis TaxID=1265935 RepID=A0ABS4JII8_9BACL|nr:cytochrome c oxidase assembly protein [Paenibacillus shirakamiensis]MBP2001534.1 putative membrane protein [Paenibacillus shirakamiensis]
MNHVHALSSVFSLNIVIFIIAIVLYITAALITNRTYRSWPRSRYFFWIAGVLITALPIIGPLANLAHLDFKAHMVGHLLLGMLAPLLLVLAAPMTLIMRTLPLALARQLSRILKSKLIRFLSDPLIAAFLNIGGLYILYLTDLYMWMQQSMLLHSIVYLHVFFAGYLFTISMIYIDQPAHRTSYVYRAVVFVFALASHGILAKYLYVHPPTGVPSSQSESGSILMYYGGDAIEIVIITILCYQWFRATRPSFAEGI